MTWDRLQPLLPFGAAIALLVACTAWLLLAEARERDMADRLAALRTDAGARQARRRGLAGIVLAALRATGASLLKRVLSPQDVRELGGMLTAGGYDAARALPLLVLAKVVCGLALPALVWGASIAFGIAGARGLALASLALMSGTMLPNVALRLLRRSYAASLRRGVPHALDLMVVCANAGLGLESAIDRVARDMRGTNPATALQFQLLSHELKVLPDRYEALRNLGDRTDQPAFRRLAATLAQALRYGTPLSQALRALAADMRQERLVRFEERTARLPALMVMPTVGFILPVLFIVLVGPSILQLLEALRGMHR